MNSKFFSCFNLESLNLLNFNSLNVDDVSNMFLNCISLEKRNVVIRDKKF